MKASTTTWSVPHTLVGVAGGYGARDAPDASG